MAISSQDLIDRMASHAMTTGYFDRVNQHEPKSKPGRGLTCAIWVERIEFARGQSGLGTTSARVSFNVRVYTNMLQEPQDMIDPQVMIATDALYEEYCGDFTLGGTIRHVDIMGTTGPGLNGQSGYIQIDGRVYRVFTILVPCIINDTWTQTA